jgi:hypothetical protein
MLGIPQIWLCVAQVILFLVVAVVLMVTDEFTPWWVWWEVAGACILLALLVWANVKFWLEQRRGF